MRSTFNMASNRGYPQRATFSGPTPSRANVGGGSIGVSKESTTAQVVTETPSSNQLPKRYDLAPYMPDNISVYGVATPSDLAPSSNQPMKTHGSSASVPETPVVSTEPTSLSASNVCSDCVETTTASATVAISKASTTSESMGDISVHDGLNYNK